MRYTTLCGRRLTLMHLAPALKLLANNPLSINNNGRESENELRPNLPIARSPMKP